MNIFSNTNRGTSKKVPLIFYPSNNIKYYDGPIPEFKKEIINSNFYNTNNKSFKDVLGVELKRHDPETLFAFIYDNSPNHLIEEIIVDTDEIRLKIDDSFNFWNAIMIDDMVNLTDCYDKEILGSAFNQFPNRNDEQIDMFHSLSQEEDMLQEEEDNFYQTIYQEFLSIENFFTYKFKGDDKKLLNKYSKKVADYLNSVSVELGSMIEYMNSLDEGDNHYPLIVTNQLSNDLQLHFGEMYICENYLPEIVFNTYGKEDIYEGKLYERSTEIKENLDQIIEEWQEEQEKILKKL